MDTNKINPSDLEAEARRLIDAGEMPSLDQLLTVIAKMRDKYGPLIIAARNQSGDAE